MTVTTGTGFFDLDSIVVYNATGQANGSQASSVDPALPLAMGNNGGSMPDNSNPVNNASNTDKFHINSANSNNG